MAEIKSTMEMVLERAAKMAADAPTPTDNEVMIRSGMRIGADFLNGKIDEPYQELIKHTAEDQMSVKKGVAQTLLRNVVLPRDEQLQLSASMAIKGILSLAQNGGEVTNACGELQQIIEQYGQHKEQTIQQLADALRAQMEQQQGGTGQPGQGSVNPAMHPQYNEELTKILTSLNNQYNDAMGQRKEMILQLLCPSS